MKTDSHDYEMQLVALGLCLASPKLLASVGPEAFDDPELSRLIGRLKEKALGEKKDSNADQWFTRRKLEVNGSISESILESVKLHARFRRAEKLASTMLLGAKALNREEYIERLKAEAEKL